MVWQFTYVIGNELPEITGILCKPSSSIDTSCFYYNSTSHHLLSPAPPGYF